MTVNTEHRSVAYLGDGVSTVFAVTYSFGAAAELIVIERTIATGVDVTLTLNVDYTVAGGGGATGTVTAVTGPPATKKWIIYRLTDLTQTVDYVENDGFPAEVHEGALDKLTRAAQDQADDLSRALKAPAGDGTVVALPAAAQRASGVLTFDVAGQPTVTPGGAYAPFDASLLEVKAASGLTLIGLGARADRMLAPQDFGAVADGVADTRAAFVAADAAGAEWLFLPSGDYVIATSVMIAARLVFAEGARLAVAAGQTVTLSGGFSAARGQHVFTGDGLIVQGGADPFAWAHFGAVGDDVADDAPPINKAMLAAKTSGVSVEVSKPAVAYRITAPVNLYDGTILRGDNRVRTIVRAERCHGLTTADSPGTAVVAGHTTDFQVSGLLFIGDDDTATDGDDYGGANLIRAIRFEFEACSFRGFTNPLILDGRRGPYGAFGISAGKFTDCLFNTNNVNQQKNPTNNYPAELALFLAEESGTGGADAVSFYNCTFYAEILSQAKVFAGDGATTTIDYGQIIAGSSKVLTVASHLQVEYVPTLGAARTGLTEGVEYSVSGVGTNEPDIDFTGGSAPLGAPPAVAVLSTTGDGATKHFHLDGRPSYPASVGGRGASVTVAAAALDPGTDWFIVDGNNKAFVAVADAGDDTLTVTTAEAENFLDSALAEKVGRLVRVSSTGTLPAGLSAATDYFAFGLDLGAGSVKLAASYADAVAGTPVNITDAGTGVHTLSIEHAIEFVAAPAGAAAIVVNDYNIRVRWIDPNATAGVKLSRGAQRIGFFSCNFGGALYGIDFNHARRCVMADPYFQICGSAWKFEADAAENVMLGFASRTDATILFDLFEDNSIAKTNGFNQYLPKGMTARQIFYIKSSIDMADSVAGMIRMNGEVVSFEAQNAAGFLQMKVGGNIVWGFSPALNAHSFYDKNGVELVRIDASGNVDLRGGGGVLGGDGAFDDLTALGAFTSKGIDDNATQEVLDLTDANWNVGVSGSALTIRRNVNDQTLTISGGSLGTSGGNILLYGGAHALAGEIRIRQAAVTRVEFDAPGSTGDMMFNDAAGAEQMRLKSSNGRLGINEASPDYKLDVNGEIGFTPGASVTPVDNGDCVFEATSNTSFTVKHKGTDGVTRSVVLTLA